MTDFSAEASTVGSLHQLTYALARLLREEDAVLRLEALDDIDLDVKGGNTHLVQLKHRAEGTTLTNTDSDLWKTLRIWCEHASSHSVDVGKVIFYMVTTAKASKGSAAEMLGNRTEVRDSDRAHDALFAAASKSKSETLKKAFKAFTNLDECKRRALLNRVFVCDGSANIDETRAQVRFELRHATTSEHRGAVVERLEGWWYGKCVDCLRGNLKEISEQELSAKVRDIADAFGPDALPIDYQKATDVAPSEAEHFSKGNLSEEDNKYRRNEAAPSALFV